MAFIFPLEALLNLRKSVEHQQEQRLRAANQRLGRVRHLIELLDGRRLELQSAQQKQLSVGTTAAELLFELQCEAGLLRQRGDLEQQRTILEKSRDQQLEVFRQARRARQTLETVREKHLRTYQIQSARREQRALDELFLMRLLAKSQ